jgi:hypothetical protein
LQFLGFFLTLLGYDIFRHHIFLQFGCYASLLMPFAFLALGAQLQGVAERLDGVRFALLTATVAALMLAPAPPYAGALFLRLHARVFASVSYPPFLFVAGVPGVLALAAFLGPVPRLCRTVVVFYLLSLGQYYASLSLDDRAQIGTFNDAIRWLYDRRDQRAFPGSKFRYVDDAGRVHSGQYGYLRVFNRHRGDALCALARTLRCVKEMGRTDHLAMWYSLGDPEGCFYDWCRYLFQCDYYNPDFPEVHGGEMVHGARLVPGVRVLVLTEPGRDVLAVARPGLREIGLDAHLVGMRPVRVKGFRYDVTYLEVVAASPHNR